DGVTFRRAAQRPAGQHADANNADTGSLGVIEHLAVVLGWVVRRERFSRTWVQHIIADLGGDEGARVDHPMQRRGVADSSDAGEAQLALLAKFLERGNDLAE